MSQQANSKTQQILDTTEKIVESVTKSEVGGIVEEVGETTENIVTTLVSSGGKPVAIILAIAVLIATLAVPIMAVKFSPNQVNPSTETSLVK